MPWRTQGTSHAIQDLIDQKIIAPSSPCGQFNLSWAKWSLNKLLSQDLIHGVFLSFFCLSSLCLLIWILRNMLLRFWFWTYHRNVCLISCLHFSFKKKKSKSKSQKKKKNLSVQLGAWALKLPSMKSPELGAWTPNDFQFPQGPKLRSPSIHPMLNEHDLQPLLFFKNVHIQK